jgi:TnpA family transposase
MTSLLDMVKETDLRLGFTNVLKSPTAYEALERSVLQPRLLLCLHGIGTNAGLQRMASLDSGTTAKDLAYVRRRYLSVDALRRAVALVADGTLRARNPAIWGSGSTACAHGQSTVAFAFCRLLGFQLLPRLKAIHSQKLYRPEAGKADVYANLQQILTRPIDWELIRQQYDQMVKYTTALRLGTAETEAILRRFTKKNVQHPTYKAFAELGKASKTIFLCRYLHSDALRREINEGLNVVEQWNGATDFVFFARRGEMASNQREDHEISMLALHLIQNCMVYINTLMIQKVLAQPHWQGRLTPRDYAALTPLIWEHVNPYGRFDLDMNARLALL